MNEIIITEKDESQRLDKYLLKFFNKAPKSFVYKMLRKKRIKLNAQKATGSELLKKGDEITMYISQETTEGLQEIDRLSEKTEISFTVLYEDKNILLVNKPAGILSQKDSKDAENSLIQQVLQYMWQNGEYEEGATFYPALANRLDRNTSGIVAVGKSVAALTVLGGALQDGGGIKKTYVTLVKGQLKYKDTYRAHLSKNEKTNTVTISKTATTRSKPITTKVAPIASNEKYTLLEVGLVTGRPHQIRAHLAFCGFPVVGDKKYGHKGTNMTFLRKYELNRQFLHAYSLAFEDVDGDFGYLKGKAFTAKLPEDIMTIVEGMFPRITL